MDLKQLREKFAKAMADANAISAKYNGVEGSMTAEEESQWGQFLDEAERVKKQIKQAEREADLKAFEQAPAKGLVLPNRTEAKTEDGEDEVEAAAKAGKWDQIADARLGRALKAAARKEYKGALVAYLRAKGDMSLIGEAERKVLTEGNDAAGGFMVPEDARLDLIRNVATMATVRQSARVVTTARDAVSFPRVPYTTDDKFTSPVRLIWTGEQPASATTARATQPTFGIERIPVHTAMASLLLSNDLLEDAAFDVEGYVNELMSEAYGLGENDAFLNGNGQGQPEGLFFSGGKNFPSSVVSGDAATIKADGLIDLFYGVPRQYRGRARWLMNSGTAKVARKLKDGQNRYLWDSMNTFANGNLATNGDQDILLGKPVTIDEFCPDIAANAYPIAFGDLQAYYIVDRVGLSVQAYREIYAESNQTLVLARRRFGGGVVEPFRIRLQKIST